MTRLGWWEARRLASRLPEPWATAVREAHGAARRYHRARARVEAGPVADRLEAIGARVDEGVRACARIAAQGARLDEAAAAMEDPDRLTERLAGLLGREDPSAVETRAALRAQLDTARRIAGTRREAAERLRLLDARLDEAVARAIELGVAVDALDDAAVRSLGGDVEAVVSEMEALRAALEDTAGL